MMVRREREREREIINLNEIRYRGLFDAKVLINDLIKITKVRFFDNRQILLKLNLS